jgi:4-diphosphocytidyl-2-C-methyl-D-erythritol kinase
MDFDYWKAELKNDFETSVFATHPVIAELKSELYRHGALYASMSGSGSSVFGIFAEKPTTIRTELSSQFILAL